MRKKFAGGSEADNVESCFDKNEIKFLRDRGIEVIHVNMRGSGSIFMNLAYVNQFILDNIDNAVRPLIPDWIKYEYIRNLFLTPGCYAGKGGCNVDSHGKQVSLFSRLITMRNTYSANRSYYPYQLYISWPRPLSKEDGNILFNDEKFLKMLYGANKDIFKAREYVIDATAETKENFYDFIDKAERVAIFVDCENVNPFSFVGMLKGMDAKNLSKIREIVLYDDKNTSSAWDYVEGYVDLSIEITHNEIDRVLDNKSLIDTTMVAGVCKAYYQGGIESIVLASSDSDFWGLISQLPLARFYVLNEKTRTAQAILDKYTEAGINHCFMDDFAQDKVQQFKTQVLMATLRKRMEKFNETGVWEFMDAGDLVDSLFREAYIMGADTQMEQEKKTFINTYLKGGFIIKFAEDADGNKPFSMELNRK